ncbi:hypothetical protein ACVWZK_003847 [Bradyrhizobium sp. GM0.4]
MPGHDRACGHVDGGDAGAAEAVERYGTRAHVVAGVQRRHAAEIAALRCDLRAAAPDDVVDVGGVDAGARRERAQHGCSQLLRMNARERPLAGLANAPRGPAGIDDECVDHWRYPLVERLEAF